MGMQNVVATVKGDKLVLEIDLNKNLGKSSTGKSYVVGTSGGFAKIDGTEVSVSLNVNKVIPKDQRG